MASGCCWGTGGIKGQFVVCAELSCVLDVWNSHSVLVLGSHASLPQCAVVMTVLWCSGIGF